jgi:limonene-1,2-epoxide hydrolase
MSDIPTEDAKKIAIVQHMFDGWREGNYEKVCEVFAEDGVMHSMMMDPWIGRDYIYERCLLIAKAATNTKINMKNIGVINGAVFTERVDSFLYHGNPVQYPAVGVFEFENGKVKLWKEYFDRATMLKGMSMSETDY